MNPDTNTQMEKRPLYAHYNASDGQHGTKSETTDGTGRYASYCLLADDNEMPRRNASACLLTDTTTERRTTRRTATRPTTRRTGREDGMKGGTTSRTNDGTKKKRAASAKRKAARKTRRDMRLNEQIATRRRYLIPPANEENQEAEHDNTHTAHASSQSPQGYP